MANGKPGDHPLTDVLVWDRPAFSPEVDALIRELAPRGFWDGEIVRFLVLVLFHDVDRLRSEGEADRAETLLENFAVVLRFERDHGSSSA